MSEIFSFRLCKSNPREARAVEIIQKKELDGLSLRHIITEALLNYESDINDGNSFDRSSVKAMLNRIIGLLSSHEQKGSMLNNNINKSDDAISEQFALTLKREVKKGLQI